MWIPGAISSTTSRPVIHPFVIVSTRSEAEDRTTRHGRDE
jgi:hypothetical protein